MRIIISEPFDYPTYDVLQWLLASEKQVLCIDGKSPIEVIWNDMDDIEFIIQDSKVKLSEISNVWFRRNRIQVQYPKTVESQDKYLRQYHFSTKFKIDEFVNFLLHNKKRCLGNPFIGNANKLIVLSEAKKLGLKIPRTIVSGQKARVLAYFQETPFITKLLAHLSEAKYQEQALRILTFACDPAELEETFSPSLFQERIEKEIEIRVFFLNGKCYSKAIFSQSDGQTVEDYRNYNYEKPNREVPFQLPNEIEKKVNMLMQSLNLNTGSLDFIVDKKHNFIFLEVNPVGQFTDLSYNCNYYVEEAIATYLA